MAISRSAVRRAITEAGFTKTRGGQTVIDVQRFAAESGLSVVHVYKLMEGERKDPQSSTMTKLCRATKKSAEFFELQEKPKTRRGKVVTNDN